MNQITLNDIYKSRNAEIKELIKVSENIKRDIKKLNKHYPIQYLIGYVSFYGYKILVNKDVLIPRPETEYLVEKTINYIKQHFNKNIKILDLCTGSGAISIALKKELSKSKIDASDISRKALNLAKKSSELNETNINFIRSNIFSNIHEKYDIIISNPPYISKSEKIDISVKKYEPHKALYACQNGLFYYEKILFEAKQYLNKKNMIALEIGSFEAEAVIKISKKYFPNSKILKEIDLSKNDRYIFIFNE